MRFGIDTHLDDTPDPAPAPPQDRGPVIAAARRVTVAEMDARLRVDDLDQRAADMRDAAIWNTILLAKQHGLTQEITETDVARWRRMRAITDDIATGANEGERVPDGFGAPVRARQTAALIKIAARTNGAAANGEAASAEGAA